MAGFGSFSLSRANRPVNLIASTGHVRAQVWHQVQPRGRVVKSGLMASNVQASVQRPHSMQVDSILRSVNRKRLNSETSEPDGQKYRHQNLLPPTVPSRIIEKRTMESH